MSSRYKVAINRLKNSINYISSEYHCRKTRIWIDALWSYIRYGVTPAEYIGFGFYKWGGLTKKQFYTARHSYKFEKLFNDPAYKNIFWDKEKFNEEFREWVNRDWIFCGNSSKENVEKFLNNHPSVIVKPTSLSSGHGIHKFNEEKDSVVILIKEKCLLEEFVTQHHEMAKLNPTSVNTIRVYTVMDKKGQVHILTASIRVGGSGAVVDNYHSGGVGYPLDVKSGVVCGAGVDINGTEHLFHPGNDEKVIGFQVPNWDGLCEFIFSACKHLKGARLIAWDVAVLEDGFEMIEGNYEGDPGFMQSPSKKGMYYQILRCK